MVIELIKSNYVVNFTSGELINTYRIKVKVVTYHLRRENIQNQSRAGSR